MAPGPVEQPIAIAAAGLGNEARDTLDLLQQECMLRLAPRQSGFAIETYHDRIRTELLDSLDSDTYRSSHFALLDAYEGAGMGSADRLAHHAKEAGETGRAADYAERAADLAADALAFARAADLYASALEWGEPDEEHTRELQSRQADALVNAGRAGEAAPLFLDAARGAAPELNRLRRRQAAEQLLVSGRTQEGISVLEPLLREHRLWLPRSPATAVGATLGRLALLRVRGTSIAPIPQAAPSEDEEARIDVCWAVARGLITVDTVRAGYLPLVGLWKALRIGDRRRSGQLLAMVGGAVLAPLGGAAARWGSSMLDQAQALASETADPYMEVAVSISDGQIGVLTGDWRRALESSERGIDTARTRCRGLQWEKNVGHTAELRALEELGELREMGKRARLLMNEADDLGDRYATFIAAQQLGIADVAAGKGEAAAERMREVMRSWPEDRFLIQHMYALKVEIYADLYMGDAAAAAARLDLARDGIRASQLMRVPAPRIDVSWLEGRIALATLETMPPDSPRADDARRAVNDAIRTLSRERLEHASAHAALLRAGLAKLEGDDESWSDALQTSIALYSRCEMAAMQRLAERARGVVRGKGAEDPGAWPERGISDPASWARVCAPAA